MARTRLNPPAASPPRRRRPLWLRLVGGFVVAVLIGACGAAGLVHWGIAKIDRSVVAGLVGNATAVASTSDRARQPRLLNVLVVGNDSREGLTTEQVRDFGTGQAEGNRTDTIMLLQVELDGAGRSAVLSFPRDLLVERCDGSEGRINAAYGIGVERDGDGPSCVVDTVAKHTGIQINHYVEVSFAGFLKVVDALGGVGLYLDEPLADEKAHIDLPAGCVQLQGRDALGFVRARHVDNDFGRMARQQRFVKETLREATDVGVLANPARLLRILDAAAASVHTDDRLGPTELREIATGLRAITAEGLAVHSVPGKATVSNGTWYVIEDAQPARRLYRSFRDGSVIRKRPKAAAPSEASPALPAVEVLNASDGKGVAAAAAELVEADGFPVATVGNAELGGLERTRILHPPELADAAARLSKLFPTADVVQGVSGLPLTVKLGADAKPAALASRATALDGASPSEHAAKVPAASEEPAYRGARMTDVDC